MPLETVRTYVVFATPVGGGHLAAVLDAARRKLLWNAPVAVLTDSAARRLHFFTRAGEMEFCGHGVLAGVCALTDEVGVQELIPEADELHVALSIDASTSCRNLP